MIAGTPLAPDGREVLAALLTLRGWPAEDLLSPALAALVTEPTASALERLTRAVARRTALPGAAREGSRSPAARFARRQLRRWCIAQATPEPLPSAIWLQTLGERAAREGLAEGAPNEAAAGLRVLVWATGDGGRRRDLVAMAEPAAAHFVGHAPPLAAAVARALLP